MTFNIEELLRIASKVGTPLALAGIIIIVLYLIYRQVLALGVVTPIGAGPTSRLLQNVLNKLFWLAILALVLGVASYIVTAVFPPNAPSHSSEGTNDPKLRATYYRMRGLSLSFLIRGLLAPDWERLLGGQQDIVKNAPFEEVSGFLRRFAQPIDGYSLSGKFPDTKLGNNREDSYFSLIDYAKSVAPRSVHQTRGYTELDSSTWTAYLGGTGFHPLFIPALEDLKTMMRSVKWPEGYSLQYTIGEWSTFRDGWDSQRVSYPPILWRPLRRKDLEDYVRSYREYERLMVRKTVPETGGFAFGHQSLSETRQWHSRVVDSLLYLTEQGIPDGFMYVRGVKGPHSGWRFEADVRDIELLILVLENVSQSALRVGKFEIRQTRNGRLRLPSVTDEELDSAPIDHLAVYPAEYLRPGEKILVPLRIQLTNKRPFEDSHASTLSRKTGQKIQMVKSELIRRQIAKKGSDLIEVVLSWQWVGNKQVPDITCKKRGDEFKAERFAAVEESFDFGPTWRVVSVEVNGASTPVRRYDPENFVLFGSHEKGSCPYLFTHSEATGLWVNEGHVLLGAIGHKNLRIDERRLEHFEGRLRVAELDYEVAFIDQLAIRTTLPTGEVIVHQSSLPELTRVDGKGVILRHGEFLDLAFSTFRQDLKQQVDCIVSGFYSPMDRLDLLGLLDGQVAR